MSSVFSFKGSKHTRQLLLLFSGLVALSILLQLGALLAMAKIDALRESGRVRTAVAANQQSLAIQYESATYLALVALSASKWEALIEQRRLGKETEVSLERHLQGLLGGGQPALAEATVRLAPTGDPKITGALREAQSLFSEVKQANVRVLRSENQTLKGNPELEGFQTASRRLRATLSNIQDMVRLHTEAKLATLDRVQQLIPLIALALTIALGAFVIQRLLVPLGASMDGLQRSEAELRVARSGLEVRVAERTAELAATNAELRRTEEQLRVANDGLERRVAERTRELKEAQHRSLDLARQAGMAEIASNVLHNVGNVLNSVTTTAALLAEQLSSSRFEMLGKVAGLLGEHRHDLASFLTTDERGKKLPDYIGKLNEHLAGERRELLAASSSLRQHIEHIRVIVDLQQSYAKRSVLEEIASVSSILDDVLRISAAALGRHEVTIEQKLAPIPPILIDKHKVLQIILNLISNSKYALAMKEPNDRRILIELERNKEDRLCIRVSDNGIGMAKETLASLFQHGFTTRQDGHGFGLHSSVLAAQALGGSLSAHSDGLGKGSTFTLELPFRAAATATADVQPPLSRPHEI